MYPQQIISCVLNKKTNKYSGTLVIIHIFIFDYIKIKLSEFCGEADKSISMSPHMIKHFITHTHTFVSSLFP